jgi:hypothetical protein
MFPACVSARITDLWLSRPGFVIVLDIIWLFPPFESPIPDNLKLVPPLFPCSWPEKGSFGDERSEMD